MLSNREVHLRSLKRASFRTWPDRAELFEAMISSVESATDEQFDSELGQHPDCLTDIMLLRPAWEKELCGQGVVYIPPGTLH